MSTYMEAVQELIASGHTPLDAHTVTRRDHPELFASLSQEAESRRPRVAGGRRQPLVRASAPTPPPTYHQLLNSAIAGSPIDPADVVHACRELHRHPSHFWGELRRQRDRIASKLASDTLTNDTAPVAAQRRSVSHSRRFDLAVCEAAKCERVFSDAEIRSAGFDVANFRSALKDAVHAKIMHRSYAVGSVVCDCSSGVCVCR
jgi:hypothetical protein